MLCLIAGACSQEESLVDRVASSPKEISEQGMFTANGSTPENLKLRALYERLRREKFRMFGFEHNYTPMQNLQRELLDRNIFLLDGASYFIGYKDNTGKVLYAAETPHRSLVLSSSGSEFRIKSMPASTGIPFLIFREGAGSKRYLGSGEYTPAWSQKSISIPWLRLDVDMMGLGWDIEPREKGLVLECDMIYTKETANSNGGYGSIEQRVLTSQSSKGYNLMSLEAYDEKNIKQHFVISPKGEYRVLGVRYFATLDSIQSSLYNLDATRGLDKAYTIKEGLEVNASDFEAREGLKMSISRESDISVTRTYENSSYEEVAWDVFFDKTVKQFSNFDERTGISMPQLSGKSLVLPTVVKNNVVCQPDRVDDAVGTYGVYQYKPRQLRAVLYALVSPRSKATITYTYSVFRVKIPYIVYLVSKNDANKVVRVFGVWEGTIFAEADQDRHFFKKESIDADPNDDSFIIEDDSDEVIEFSHTTLELEKMGYINRDGLRAITQPKRMKI